MVLALHFRRPAVNRSAVNTAIAALALTVLCDALFTSPLLREHYHSGQILDAGWFAGSLLLAYAPWVGARARSAHAAAPGRRHPPGRHLADRADPLPGRRRLHPGHPLQRPGRPEVRPRGDLHRLHGGARPGGPPGHHAARQHRPHPGTGPEGEPLPLPGAGLQRRHHDRRPHRRPAVRQPGRRRVSTAATPEEMVGTELASHIHPEDLGRVVHEVRRFLAARPARSPPPASSAASAPPGRRRGGRAGSTSSPPSTATRAA